MNTNLHQPALWRPSSAPQPTSSDTKPTFIHNWISVRDQNKRVCTRQVSFSSGCSISHEMDSKQLGRTGTIPFGSRLPRPVAAEGMSLTFTLVFWTTQCWHVKQTLLRHRHPYRAHRIGRTQTHSLKLATLSHNTLWWWRWMRLIFRVCVCRNRCRSVYSLYHQERLKHIPMLFLQNSGLLCSGGL